MTQVAVARHLGITQASLSAFETGKNETMRKATLNKIIALVKGWRSEQKIVSLGIPATASRGAAGGHVVSGLEHTTPDRQAGGEFAIAEMQTAIAEYLGDDKAAYRITGRMTPTALLRAYIMVLQLTEGVT